MSLSLHRLIWLVCLLFSPAIVAGEVSARANPFGIMPGNASRIPLAVELGVSYYRPNAVFLDKWNGRCRECDAAHAAGLRLALTVRNNGGPKTPTTPPTDYVVFRRTLGDVLDRYRPAILAVENEENSQALFYQGAPEAYHAELRAACEVAHTRGIPCTNGGLVSSLAALLVAEHYREQGNRARAEDYLRRTLGAKLEARKGAGRVERLLDNPATHEQIARGKALLAGYRAAGADYVNFHWYIPDTRALREAVAYLRATTGLPAMTNEIGQQRSEDPQDVTRLMRAVLDLGLPYAVWFSIDVPGYGGARALTSNSGLRSNGEAFRDFIRANKP